MDASVFSNDRLARIIRETLPADAKPGENVIVGSVDQDGAQIVVGFQRGLGAAGYWTIEAVARHEWSGSNSVGATVLLRW